MIGSGSLLAQLLGLAALVGVLGFAVSRPRGLPEAVAAVPAAALLVAIGAITPAAAWHECRQLFGVVAFLGAVLVLARLCDAAGLFRALGAWAGRHSRGRARRLLLLVFVVGATVTAVLSLDATVVLLTPVVFATAAHVRLRPKPHVYACTHLANSASLLLPVSNLTNLLAFGVVHVSFGRFCALMAAPWLAVVAVEYVVFGRFFAIDLAGDTQADDTDLPPVEGPPMPRYTVAVLAATLAGFALTSLFGIAPAWAALAGAIALAVPRLRHRDVTAKDLAHAVSVPFLLFVPALGIVVHTAVSGGVTHTLDAIVPHGVGPLDLLAIAGIAVVLANLVNNLPAVLVLLPIVATRGTGAVLATLIGVNVGPNLSYMGSLATLLWRAILRRHDTEPSLREFTRLGLATVPLAVVIGVLALAGALAAIGPR
jgi:arsenical pump membrane protein